jgi:hypothetical protein
MEGWLSSDIAIAAIGFFSVPEDASFWTLINSPFLVAIIATMIGFRLNARLTKAQRELNSQIAETQSDADTALRIATESTEMDQDEELFGTRTPEAARSSMSASVDISSYRKNKAEPETEANPDQDEVVSRVNEDTLGFESYEELSGSDDISPSASILAEDASVPFEAPRDDARKQAEQIADLARTRIDSLIQRDTDGRHQRTYGKISKRNPIALVIALSERGQLTEQEAHNIIALFRIWNKYSKGRAANTAVPASVVAQMKKLITAF